MASDSASGSRSLTPRDAARRTLTHSSSTGTPRARSSSDVASAIESNAPGRSPVTCPNLARNDTSTRRSPRSMARSLRGVTGTAAAASSTVAPTLRRSDASTAPTTAGYVVTAATPWWRNSGLALRTSSTRRSTSPLACRTNSMSRSEGKLWLNVRTRRGAPRSSHHTRRSPPSSLRRRPSVDARALASTASTSSRLTLHTPAYVSRQSRRSMPRVRHGCR
jgi:hypothetical protein